MDLDTFLKGYADAQPSESIQNHSLPCLSVSVVIPFLEFDDILVPPVKQYKDYTQKNKAACADKLANWLFDWKNKGLKIAGFTHAHNMDKAARFGMKFIEELPNASVEKHYQSYRLFFEKDHIDFPQAVALQYYFFTINLGALRAATLLKQESRRLLILMDRFSGEKVYDKTPENPISITPGLKFLNYIEKKSKSGISIADKNRSINLELRFTTLDWWKWRGQNEWKEGKTHPHFVLSDWLAAASSASQFPNEYCACFKNEKFGIKAVKSLTTLYSVFKSYDIWSMEDNALDFIGPMEQLWEIPQVAKDFIISRTTRI